MKIKCFGCGESGEYYPYVPSKVYCFSCYNKVVQERDKLKTENERSTEALKTIIQLVSKFNRWSELGIKTDNGETLIEMIENIANQILKEVTK